MIATTWLIGYLVAECSISYYWNLRQSIELVVLLLVGLFIFTLLPATPIGSFICMMWLAFGSFLVMMRRHSNYTAYEELTSDLPVIIWLVSQVYLWYIASQTNGGVAMVGALGLIVSYALSSLWIRDKQAVWGIRTRYLALIFIVPALNVLAH